MSQWDCWAPDVENAGDPDEWEMDVIGKVIVPGMDMGTVALEPAEAREFAAALLRCADHAEAHLRPANETEVAR